MKPATTIVVIILIGLSIAHLLRLIFQVEITIGGYQMPVWLSIFGFIVPATLALMLWKENRKRIYQRNPAAKK